jgi:hypothetical protein
MISCEGRGDERAPTNITAQHALQRFLHIQPSLSP